MFTKDVKLWDHQKEVRDKALSQQNYALFLDLGTGKTCTTIQILANHYNRHRRVLSTLILCPISVTENWRREIIRFSNVDPSNIVMLTGTAKKREELIKNSMRSTGKIMIMNYEGLIMKPVLNLLLEVAPQILVLDESQRCKSYKARRTVAAIQLSSRAWHRYILSGTPILNSPMDIFTQFHILDRGETFGKNFFAFRQAYFYDQNAGMPSHKYFPAWRPRPGTYEELQRKIYMKASRVMKSECLDLPPLTRARVYCDMSPQQAKAYKDMLKNFIAYVGDSACVASLALTKALRLQQIVTGFIVDENENALVFDKNPRIEALKDTLEDIPPGEKAIIWASFRENYRHIESLFLKEGYSYRVLVGGISDSERQKAIDDFQNDPSVRFLIANQAAGGVGINLTAASYAVYYSRSFRLEDDLQSEARNYRGGSCQHDKITRIDIVTPGTIDEVILDVLARKESIANHILTLKDRL